MVIWKALTGAVVVESKRLQDFTECQLLVKVVRYVTTRHAKKTYHIRYVRCGVPR